MSTTIRRAAARELKTASRTLRRRYWAARQDRCSVLEALTFARAHERYENSLK